jgi:diguanylate cyclase (GGDEF)-like protein
VVVVAVVLLASVSVGTAALALARVRSAHAEITKLNSRNIARLTVLGEIRGQQARINDGVAFVLLPAAPPAVVAAAKARITLAAATTDRLMAQYQDLVRGTSAQATFATLMDSWRLFDDGLSVYALGAGPAPAVQLLPGPRRLGELTGSITDGLDRQADLERVDAAAVATSWHRAYRDTIRQIGLSLLVGLVLAAAVAGLAVRAEAGRRRISDQLAHDASHDALTGLANRAAFLAKLAVAVAAAELRGHRTAVLYLDLNDFKQVNDTWGHETGDGLLVGFGRLLQRSVLGADTVARLGGDEFGVVLAHIDAPEHAQAVARRIIAGLADPIVTAGRPIQTRASIGIAVSGADCADTDELLRRADFAMYAVKRQKTNGWRVYADELRADALRILPTAEELQHGIATDQLRLQYQPIVALHNGELLGVEALVRWQHPTLGSVAPLDFIPLADASGLMVALGDWVLRHACAQVRGWQQRGRQGRQGRLQLSVNLSPRQLDDPGLVGGVLATLDSSGLSARDLILEITEDALVSDAAIPVLAELRSHGIRLALDDFGTGYSSLRYLTNLPVDILKLDRCFVAELDGSKEGSAVAEAVIRLSQALNLETIAEGIENVAQATELTLLGCPLAQGYHFARPLDPDALEALLDSSPGALPARATTSPTPVSSP